MKARQASNVILSVLLFPHWVSADKTQSLAVETFGFMLGKHDCEVTHTPPGGKPNHSFAYWDGRLFANAQAIADDFYTYTDPKHVSQFGTTYRTYSEQQGWTSKFFNTGAQTWVDVGTEAMGGVTKEGDKIRFLAGDSWNNRWDVTIDTSPKDGFIWSGKTIAWEGGGEAGHEGFIRCKRSSR